VQRAIDEAVEGRTSITIAHRLSTIKHVDRICVMDEGRLVEEGPYDELLDNDGVFAKMVAAQRVGVRACRSTPYRVIADSLQVKQTMSQAHDSIADFAAPSRKVSYATDCGIGSRVIRSVSSFDGYATCDQATRKVCDLHRLS